MAPRYGCLTMCCLLLCLFVCVFVRRYVYVCYCWVVVLCVYRNMVRMCFFMRLTVALFAVLFVAGDVWLLFFRVRVYI